MRFRARSRSAPAAGDGALIRRMLGLAWRYRRGCFQALGLQVLLLVLALSGLGLMGLGVDIIRYHLPGAAITKPPRWPCGWTPPRGHASARPSRKCWRMTRCGRSSAVRGMP